MIGRYDCQEVVIRSSTSASKQADRLAAEGKYAAAARRRAQSAQSRLEQFGIESGANTDLMVGDLLYAIYYARRGAKPEMAVNVRTTLVSYAALLQHAAYTAVLEEWPDSTRTCLVGLFEEWIGDAYLFTDTSEATRYYDRAETWYSIEECRAADRISKELPCWGWGAEPQFDEAMLAFVDYLEWFESAFVDKITLNEYNSLFFNRLDYKRSLVERMENAQ